MFLSCTIISYPAYKSRLWKGGRTDGDGRTAVSKVPEDMDLVDCWRPMTDDSAFIAKICRCANADWLRMAGPFNLAQLNCRPFSQTLRLGWLRKLCLVPFPIRRLSPTSVYLTTLFYQWSYFSSHKNRQRRQIFEIPVSIATYAALNEYR